MKGSTSESEWQDTLYDSSPKEIDWYALRKRFVSWNRWRDDGLEVIFDYRLYRIIGQVLAVGQVVVVMDENWRVLGSTSIMNGMKVKAVLVRCSDLPR